VRDKRRERRDRPVACSQPFLDLADAYRLAGLNLHFDSVRSQYIARSRGEVVARFDTLRAAAASLEARAPRERPAPRPGPRGAGDRETGGTLVSPPRE
jgi:hypothetical protein